eukprot:CAMPEP_0172488780 /NCGR_PEP_ID=MMETSP1066-20121228/18515_1 /TAXON_ID=671091 /ORGANISM="Coscinodiscus wailesii, Strain CCMP2513" /LENGTH=236 /DNA_ID=CAMNT_0013256237 /DNA_START=80 /DNA_END=790 /DNA_ORIENTATION=+
MNKFNHLLIITLLAKTGDGFSAVPVIKHSAEKTVTQKDAPPSDEAKPTSPPPTLSFARPSSLVKRAFDDMLFPRSSFRRPFFDDFFDFRPSLLAGMNIMPSLFDDFDRRTTTSDMMLRTTTRSSPSYEIVEDDNSMKLIIDVPGVKAEDIIVEIEAEGKMLHVSGERVTEKDGNVSKYSFDQRFGIGSQLDSDGVTANLADGVLTVVAPKLAAEARNVRKIEVTEGSQISESTNDE